MRKVLLEEYGYDEDYAEGVSSLICQSDDEKIIFVITEDMLNKAQAIAYYGLWDFSGDTSSGKIPEGCMLNRLYNESDPVGRFTHICSSSDSDRQYGASVWILN